MDDSSIDRLRPLVGPTYFVAWLFILVPAMDFLFTVWPLQFGQITWRYGTVGLLGGFLLSPLLGATMILLLARVMGHRGLLRVMTVLLLAGGILLLIGVVSFILDAVQLRGGVPEAERWAFDTGVIKALVKDLTGAIALSWLAGGSFQASRGPAGASRGGSPLVVGESAKG